MRLASLFRALPLCGALFLMAAEDDCTIDYRGSRRGGELLAAADFIVDPIKVKDLQPLAGVFADPAQQKVFHAAEGDISNGFEPEMVQEAFRPKH